VSADEIIVALLECIYQAIDSGDWKVDGACDPDSEISRAEYFLRKSGWTKDGITGTTWIKG